MRAIELPDYTLNIVRAAKSMFISDKKTRELKEDEVLLKVAASPINPSDISFIQGRYNIRKALPATPGFEACGKVISCGASDNARAMEGKRVSCFTSVDDYGAWAEEMIVKASDCIELLDDIPDEQAACLSINPFTAYAMYRIARNSRANAIILNAAGSQVSGFVRDMAKSDGIPVINIVRKENTLEMLKKAGAAFIINQQDEDFEKQLNSICRELNADIAFDAVGGEATGVLINNMAEGGSVYVYGGLSGKAISNINILEIIFQKKVLKGFDLSQWLKKLSRQEFLDISLELQRSIIEGKFQTRIHDVYAMKDYEKAIFAYIKNMSAGKIIIRPD